MRASSLVQLGTGIGVLSLLLLGNGFRPTSGPVWHEASRVAEYAASAAFDMAESASSMLGGSSKPMAEDATQAAMAGFTSLFGDGGAPPTPQQAVVIDDVLSPKHGAPCLITKWSAVWVVDKAGARSHVGFPTAGCETRAAPVEDLAAYTKAHGGQGDFFLDQQKSADACKLSECRAAVDGGGGSDASAGRASGEAGAQHPNVPLNGWGEGVAAGGAWMARTSLRFNAPARASFGALALRAGEPLLLVFGGASVTDMLKNWALHARAITPPMPFAVACMDEKLFELAEGLGYPAVVMKEGEGGESSVSTRWTSITSTCMCMGVCIQPTRARVHAAGLDAVEVLPDGPEGLLGDGHPQGALLPRVHALGLRRALLRPRRHVARRPAAVPTGAPHTSAQRLACTPCPARTAERPRADDPPRARRARAAAGGCRGARTARRCSRSRT